jgi:uncharacterized membrane protein YhaH (DUF805 family)
MSFQTRARRSEFWWYYLAYVIGLVVLYTIDGIVFKQAILSGLYILALLLPTLGVGIRRMHDTGRSGWWVLLPIGNLVFWAQEGEAGSNKYGPSPKEAVAA